MEGEGQTQEVGVGGVSRRVTVMIQVPKTRGTTIGRGGGALLLGGNS